MAIKEFLKNENNVLVNDVMKDVLNNFINDENTDYSKYDNLYDSIISDSNNSSKFDTKEINAVNNNLIVSALNKIPKEDKTKRYEVMNKVNTLLNGGKEIVYINGEIKEFDNYLYDHIFIIKVKPENYIETFNKLKESFKDLNNTAIITYPIKIVGNGYQMSFRINTNMEELDNVINILDNLKEVKSISLKLPTIFNRLNTWYGYDQAKRDTKESVTKQFVNAINDSLVTTTFNYIKENNKSDLYNINMDSDLKLPIIKEILKESALKEDFLISNILLNVRSYFDKYGIDNNLSLNDKLIVEELEKLYSNNEEVEEFTPFEIKTPVVIEGLVDEKNDTYNIEETEVEDNNLIAVTLENEEKVNNMLKELENPSFSTLSTKEEEKKVENENIYEIDASFFENDSLKNIEESLIKYVDDLKEEEIKSLTKEETHEIKEEYNKYEEYVTDLSLLDKKIKNKDMSIYDYFEEQDIMKKIKNNATILLHDEDIVSVKEFVSSNIIDYLEKVGYDKLDNIIDLYAENINYKSKMKKRVKE